MSSSLSEHLDDYKMFNRIYEAPIIRSRAPNCLEKQRELGTARLDQLLEISKSFVLRRSADILENYLPPKRESRGPSTPSVTNIRLGSYRRICSVRPAEPSPAPPLQRHTQPGCRRRRCAEHHEITLAHQHSH